MVLLYLVRHAESEANTQGIYQGISYDTNLSDMGKKQAQALAKRFMSVPLNSILASPLKRTMQTAHAVSQKKQLKVEPVPDLLETNHGRWEGMKKTDIEKKWPHLYKKWQKFPSHVEFPGGERFIDTQQRVMSWWNRRAPDLAGRVFVVTHDNIIRILVASILNKKLNSIWKYSLQPTSVTEIHVYDDHVKLTMLGGQDHLGSLAVDVGRHAL